MARGGDGTGRGWHWAGMALGRDGTGRGWHWAGMALGRDGTGRGWHWAGMALSMPTPNIVAVQQVSTEDGMQIQSTLSFSSCKNPRSSYINDS